MSFRVGVLTISDKGSSGEREDLSGPAIREALGNAGDVVRSDIVPDERDRIAGVLRTWADSGEMDLIFTTGGTGLTARDVTPEATLAVLEREAPGIAEALRAESRQVTPMAMLSRGVPGTRGAALLRHLA